MNNYEAHIMKATIQERGNGFCDIGDYVSEAGNLYRVTAMGSNIHTGQSGNGEANTVDAEVEDADWDDISDAEADSIICSCVVDTDTP